jgi:trk system potassium uptake protein
MTRSNSSVTRPAPLFARFFSSWRTLSPSALFVSSFCFLILLATTGLLLLPGMQKGPSLGFVDALFMSTSAVCVTGLVVVDTATHFTFAGQLWLLIFIQLGGLGLITLTTLVIGSLGRRLSLRSEMLIVPSIDPSKKRFGVTSIAAGAFIFTLVMEAIGAALLWPQFMGAGFSPLEAAWHAIFHSVSAFCNAGFSTFSTSLVDHSRSPGILFTISLLVIWGGLGYLTTEELARWWRARRKHVPQRLSTHSFAVVVSTGCLLVFGAALFTALEWNGALQAMGPLDKLSNGWFMSVTPRTAGFNSVPYAELRNDSILLTVMLMTIGGSPGSMAGGFKTTTLAIIFALAVARLRSRRQVELHGRSIPDETVQKTVSLVLVGFLLVVLSVFVLHLGEPSGDRSVVLPLLFEVVSAFGTVGLSMDVTPQLGPLEKLVVTLLMFLGRVGPLSFFAALSIKDSIVPRGMRAAREDLIVG